MATKPFATFSRSFDLDGASGILSPGSAGSVAVTAATGADVVQAIVTNSPFPVRSSGSLELGRIHLEANAGKDIVFDAGETRVQCKASAATTAGIGVFDDPAGALASLSLDETPGLELTIPGATGQRFLVLSWAYEIEGSAKGTHPIGALGSVGFAVDASRGGLNAVLRRFAATDGAHDVIRQTVSSWRLPRHVNNAGQLAPSTWLVAEAEGRIAAEISAQLGYDFTFVREAKALGLTGDIGLKIDARAKATLGIEVSGRYVVVVGRENESSRVRVRLFKLDKKGLTFGMNLAVGVKGITDALPDSADDFVKAVFGLQGRQVVRDLLLIEKWTDPSKSLSETVAGLATSTGMDLLKEATGIDPKMKFNEARAQALAALRLWDNLPQEVSSIVWHTLETGTSIPPEILGNQAVSSAVQKIVADGVIRRLQGFIGERLNLDAIRTAITQTDFQKVDGWLIQRLSQFLDQQVSFDKLGEVKNLINAVVRKRQEVFAAAKKALGNRYSFDVAATWSKTTAQNAVLDAEFDLDNAGARDLIASILAKGDIDRLLTAQDSGVTLHTAVLSHGISRRSSIEVNMPYLSFRTDHINESLAKVAAQDDGARVLLYKLDASDTVTVRNRLRSQLSVAASFPLQTGTNLRTFSTDALSWTYEYAAVYENIRRGELDARTGPLAVEYMPEQFPQGPPSSPNPDQRSGAIVTLQVSAPASALSAWFRARSAAELKGDSVVLSRRLQLVLKQLVPFYYLQETARLRQSPEVGALLTWAAIPPAATEKDAYWNFRDPDLRRTMAGSPTTTAALRQSLAAARKRLLEAGETGQADFFVAEEADDFRGLALSGHGGILLDALLGFEAQVVHQAVDALQDIQKFRESAPGSPSKAIERLADLGAEITDAFHGRLSPVYGDDALRTLGSLVFVESSRVLDPALRNARPKALLRIITLREQSQYAPRDFLKGIPPGDADIAQIQTLCS